MTSTMIDTHTHLYSSKFDQQEASEPSPMAGQLEAIDRAVVAGVSRMLLPGCEMADVAALKALKALRPESIRIAMALHPTEMGPDPLGQLEAVLAEQRANVTDYVAVGECGMDLYWEQDTLDVQQRVFDAQLAFAAGVGLPVLIHCRKALELTLEVLSDHKDVPAVFHSFEGTVADVEAIRKAGDYYFGINGIVTFKNTTLREALPAIDPHRLLLETDSPYLAPVPHRGRRNESAYLPLIAAQIATTLGIEPTEVDALTTANALRLIPGLK